jgi:hypothetical protein
MSATIAAAIFLPCAPIGMAVCYWRGRLREERRRAQQFAEQVEYWMIVRGRHG